MVAVSELNLTAALEYTQERQQAQSGAAHVDRLPAADMADCIASGLSGQALAQALTRYFPTTGRSDVYLAIGLAVAIMQADLTIGQMELARLKYAQVRT